MLLGTYCGNTARGRDCAHRPARLSESVSEHFDEGLWIKERVKIQLRMQLKEGRCRMGCGMRPSTLRLKETDSRKSGAKRLGKIELSHVGEGTFRVGP